MKKCLSVCVSLIFLLCSPCYAYDGATNMLDKADVKLLNDRAEWMSHTEAEQFSYILMYMPKINMVMNLPPDTFKASDVHIMASTDPAYGQACAYTDYKTGQIYLCIPKINSENLPGWGALFTLAHETRHLYQDKYNTLPYNPASVISNKEVYDNDVREKDANDFASGFVDYILGRQSVE